MSVAGVFVRIFWTLQQRRDTYLHTVLKKVTSENTKLKQEPKSISSSLYTIVATQSAFK